MLVLNLFDQNSGLINLCTICNCSSVNDFNIFLPAEQPSTNHGDNLPVCICCTALGVLHLIKSVCPDVSGKHVVILGRSTIVGKPLASLLSNNDATVTLCHSKTKNLEAITVKADIIVTAIGVAEKFGLKYFSQGQIVIDVGINQSNFKNKLVGDVNFDEAVTKVAFISPVPGGVGPMTVAYLMANTIAAAKLEAKLN
jgi:methylenetetrahydrofolate dehydrogenase (NADP+)/methenyltetrahydrofolate cyclohydrolase